MKFVLGCITLALLEEAITTAMTNCAPFFGVPFGQAYITASANYFDVVLYHSVVIFVPLFIGWAVLLWRWRFPPLAVFRALWDHGSTRRDALVRATESRQLRDVDLRLRPDGLAARLRVPADRPARMPRWWAYPIAVVVPFLFLPLLVVLAPWLWLTPKHPPIHF